MVPKRLLWPENSAVRAAIFDGKKIHGHVF